MSKHFASVFSCLRASFTDCFLFHTFFCQVYAYYITLSPQYYISHTKLSFVHSWQCVTSWKHICYVILLHYVSIFSFWTSTWRYLRWKISGLSRKRASFMIPALYKRLNQAQYLCYDKLEWNTYDVASIVDHTRYYKVLVVI